MTSKEYLSAGELFLQEIILKIKDYNPRLFYYPPNNEYDISNLECIEAMLLNRRYLANYFKFIEDVTKVFFFIQDQNSKRTEIHRMSLEGERIFTREINTFMNNLGYCCGNWFPKSSFKSIECRGKRHCLIKQNAGYYHFGSWNYCQECFNNLPQRDVMMGNELIIDKADFTYSTLLTEEFETYIRCYKCKRIQHERCVLHPKNFQMPFYCNKCCKQNPNFSNIHLSSDLIPKSECDTFIENYLKEQGIPNAKTINIRLVCNVPTTFKPKESISNYWNDWNSDSCISYNNCLMLSFFKLSDESEICFLAIYFQLYSHKDCPVPNRNSVYLSYIDSVKLSELNERTRTYQCILFGLFEFLKLRNFHKVFIWSCPPKKNNDFIFPEKPPNMKIPTKARLSDWYRNLAESALEKNVIESYCCVDKYAKDENWIDLKNIPYFDGDLWAARQDDAIKIAEQKSKKGKLMSTEINNFLRAQINGAKDYYFILQLKATQQFPIIKPEMPRVIPYKWISNRASLVNMLNDDKLYFSDMRAAKFSTVTLVHKILFDMRVCVQCKMKSAIPLDNALVCITCFKPQNNSTESILTDRTVIQRNIANTFMPVVHFKSMIKRESELIQDDWEVVSRRPLPRKRPITDENTEIAASKRFKRATVSQEMYKRQYTPIITRSAIKKPKKYLI